LKGKSKVVILNHKGKEEKFRIQFDKKGRGVLEVSVEVKDINETLVSEASFKWFIQAL
jgi:hypothetical protein